MFNGPKLVDAKWFQILEVYSEEVKKNVRDEEIEPQQGTREVLYQPTQCLVDM
jgi:hypothetical protein